LDKGRTQLAGVSVLGDTWWQAVWPDVQAQVSLTPQWSRRIAELLLPLMYWQEPLSRTRCRQRKASLLEAFRRLRRRLRGTLAPSPWRPMCWQTGKCGRVSMPRPFSGPPRPLKAAMALCRRGIRISAACPRAAPRCGRSCTTLIAVPRTGRPLPRAFSDGSFQTCVRRWCQRSMTCHGRVNAIRPSR
jgi:hypothetical protein